jgi:N-acetyltransferase 10
MSKHTNNLILFPLTESRYEIEEGAPGWATAEKQVLAATKSGNKNPVVSVKSSKEKKRKAGETAAEIYEQELGGEREKGSKKAKKEGKSSKKSR